MGAQPTRVFPEVDPDPQGQVNYATSESECIVITYRRNECHKHPKTMQLKLKIIIKKFMIFILKDANPLQVAPIMYFHP